MVSAAIETYQKAEAMLKQKEAMVQKRREQLESSARSIGEKKFSYYISEKKRNREKYEASLEKLKADYEKYEAYCDSHLECKVDEDADKVITGYKFDVKRMTEFVEQTYEFYIEALEKQSKALKEQRDMMAKEEDDRLNREYRMTFGRERPKNVIKEKQPYEVNDGPHPCVTYLEEINKPKDIEKENEEEDYVKSFGNITVKERDPAKDKEIDDRIKAKNKFDSEVRPLLTAEEIEVFDDKDYMEGPDKRRIHLMTVEDAKKAIETLSADIKNLRAFRNDSMNLPSEKDWDDYDYLTKSQQLEVIEKSNRNTKVKSIKKFSKK